MVRSLEDARRQATPGRGRIPPHDLQAEESLLGAMLLSRDAIVEAVQICTGEDFYKPAHGHVFEAVCSLYGQGEPADPVTVADELRRADLLEPIGGLATLVSLQANTPATSNARRYAQIVEEHALLRRLIGVAGEIAELGYELPEDVSAAVDRAESMVFEVAQRRVTTSTRPLRELLADQLDRLEALYERGESITGIPSGYTELDEMLAGLQPSNLIIVGARPSMGKTALALGIAAHAAMDAQVPVLLFSLEMSHLEITQRLLCSEARVDAQRMRTGKLHESDWSKVAHAMGRLGEAPVFIDDNPNITVMDIRAKARRQKAREGLGLVIVDYLQLMSSRARVENRQLEVSEISRNLKILARELEVPVIALSQLSRNLETRSDKRPVLADLRESGCMPAATRLTRADTGEEVSLGELVLSQEQPLVWSLDDSWRLTPQRLTRTFPSGVRPVFRLRLRSGYGVDATANHPFRTVKGWTRLDQLEVGDFLAVPRRLPAPLEERRWDEDEIVLLAHLLGDGSVGPGVKYATSDPANKAAVEEAALRRFGIEVSGSKVKNTWQLRLPSPYRLTHGRHHPVRNWLEPLGLWGARAHDKFVPEEVFGIGEDQVRLFLRHLWATDGSITLTRNGRGNYVTIYYASTSHRLSNDVRRLLLRLGIRSRLSRGRKVGYRDGWNVGVEGSENLTRFLNLMGCHGQRGECVPEALRILADIGKNPNLDDGELTDLATSDVFWDEIVEVVALGPMPTFDATVEGTHNFIADGVIAHNSIEQDADVVMFIYRDEVYNPESADRGTAEVLVAKHRNGPTGKTELAFLGQYTRFANIARL
ncbi:MAG TPA: replicative DNA helicase [Acidimicrobiales bacterium]|nr:replicative DNA helicase [Acidimicrobiales bacterium]